MSSPYQSLLALSVAAVLVSAVTVLWLGPIRSVLAAMSTQGFALGGVAALLGVHAGDYTLVVTAGVVVAIKGVGAPAILRRMAGPDLSRREVRPVVNVPASLIAAATLAFLAFATTRNLVSLVPAPAGTLLPVGFATVLVGFFVLIARRMPVYQMVGILLVDNGVASIAFLLSAGVPLLVELGASLDVLLGVVVLVALGSRLREHHGDLHLDALQELHD